MSEWKLVIHGGAGCDAPCPWRSRIMCERARQGLRDALDAGSRSPRAKAEARSTRSKPPCACSRRSLLQRRPRQRAQRRRPGRAGCRDHGRRQPARRRGRRACGRPARRSALRGTLMERGPHVFLSYDGADDFAREAGLGAGREWLVRDRASAAASSTSCWRRAAFDAEVKYGTVGAVAVDSERPCRRRDLDRRADRQALGPDRRFAADRRRHLCRRPLGGRLGDRVGRIFHPRRRRRTSSPSASGSAGETLQAGARRSARRTSRSLAATAG